MFHLLYSNSYSQSALDENSTFRRLSARKKIKLQEILKFGNSGDNETILFKPRELIVSKSAEYFVYDQDDRRIKRYNAFGEYTGYFGGKGQGPGEIMNSTCMKISPEGNIIIYDYNYRFSFFSQEGDFLDIKSDQAIRKYRVHIEGFTPVTDTTIIFKATMLRRLKGHDFESTKPTEQNSLLYLGRLNFSTSAVDIIDSCEVCQVFVIGYYMVSKPFPGDLLWGLQPKGTIVTIDSHEQFGEIYTQDGKKLTQFPLDIERIPVTGKERDEYFNDESMQKFNVKNLKRYLTISKFKPICEALFIDEKGYIMLQGRKLNRDNCEYHVYSPEGEKIGKSRMRYISEDAVFMGEYIYDIVRPEDDYPYVVKYQIKY